MKRAHILHNPNAGKEDYSKKELVAIVESQGFECGYSSTKEKGWKKIHAKTDFLVVAGGDGTVRKVAVKLLAELKGKTPPVALLPLGTANNIARSLGINGHAKEIIGNLSKDKKKKYDVGIIDGLENRMIFLESFGYGVFPELMKRMKKNPPLEAGTPEEEIKAAQKLLHIIITSYPAETFTIVVDGVEQKGKFILTEVMNINSIGPNLNLSPHADPGDGQFEVALVPEERRSEFADYVLGMINGEEKEFMPLMLQGKEISVVTASKNLHIDDELMNVKKAVRINIRPDAAMMEFLVV